MDPLINKFKLCFLAASLLLFATVHGHAVVTGTVFCDQCKDGEISIFDYPINGKYVTFLDYIYNVDLTWYQSDS